MESSRGGRIQLYQYLYTHYSRLQFSRNVDRPVAIAGLENRLIRNLNIRGGFGVLDDETRGLLRRSLLWCRADGQLRLKKIDFSQASELCTTVPTPPSWSWMAYEGAIDYVVPPFNQVHWDERNVISPWSKSPRETWSYSGDSSIFPRSLNVLARGLDIEKAMDVLRDRSIVLDDPQLEFAKLGLECVILGRLSSLIRQEARGEWIYLVLLVRVNKIQCEYQGLTVYQRVGVGSVPGSMIYWDGDSNSGVIQ